MEYKKYNKIKTALNPLQDINNTPFNRKRANVFRVSSHFVFFAFLLFIVLRCL